jgi:DNA-binding MarR family transcriptional regulator/GNAT superfamily N-acetyltransferase
MEQALVSRVRRFNRFVTQRVGALNDHYLSRERALGEARLLWEIGEGGREVRALRAELDLDSGYLSRLLRSLEAAGLVTIGAKESDRRIRVVRLTRAGRAERAVLDRRSDALAVSMLRHLNDRQRTRLATAMSDVEHLLTASMVAVGAVDPADPHARHCLREYFSELDHRFDTGFDRALSISADEHELRPPAGVLLVATLRSEPVGCGALKLHDDAPAEIKRMWVDRSARGLGLGRRLLSELEAYATEHGADAVRLETNRTLTEAIALYRSAGYVEVEPFNDEAYAHHWFEKKITPPRAPTDRGT